ncbi:hypothetical protein EV361DRAFT_874680, partial [Lentinula raphanica]
SSDNEEADEEEEEQQKVKKFMNRRKKAMTEFQVDEEEEEKPKVKKSMIKSKKVTTKPQAVEDKEEEQKVKKPIHRQKKVTKEDSASRPPTLVQLPAKRSTTKIQPLPPPPMKRGVISRNVPQPMKNSVAEDQSVPVPLKRKPLVASERPPVKGSSNEIQRGWEVLKEYLSGSATLSTQPLVEAELKSILGRDVAVESPWRVKIAAITGLEDDDDYNRHALLDEINAEIRRVSHTPTSSISDNHETASGAGARSRSSPKPTHPSTPTPLVPEAPDTPHASEAPNTPFASEASYPHDNDLSPRNRELMVTARADLEKDLEFCRRAECHNSQMAQDIWSQLLDQFFECAEKRLYPSNVMGGPRKHLSREDTDISDLRAYILSHEPNQYFLLRDSAQTEWLDIEKMGEELDEGLRLKYYTSDAEESGLGEEPQGFDAIEWSDGDNKEDMDLPPGQRL